MTAIVKTKTVDFSSYISLQSRAYFFYSFMFLCALMLVIYHFHTASGKIESVHCIVFVTSPHLHMITKTVLISTVDYLCAKYCNRKRLNLIFKTCWIHVYVQAWLKCSKLITLVYETLRLISCNTQVL